MYIRKTLISSKTIESEVFPRFLGCAAVPQDEIRTVYLRIDTFSSEFFEHDDSTLGRTSGRGGGGGGATRLRFFSVCFLEDKTSALDVLSNCSFIPLALFESSVSTVTRYDVIRRRWSSHF